MTAAAVTARCWRWAGYRCAASTGCWSPWPTQLIRASAAASLATDAAAARALRRRQDSGPVTTDQVSFTAARHHAVCSMIQSKVTAGTSLAALAALAEETSSVTLHTLTVTGRQRHSPRAQKARPGFPHTAVTKKTVTGVPQVTRFQPQISGR